MTTRTGIWLRGLAYGYEDWHMATRTGIWLRGLAYGYEDWHMATRTGIWLRGLAYGCEDWHMAARTGIWLRGLAYDYEDWNMTTRITPSFFVIENEAKPSTKTGRKKYIITHLLHCRVHSDILIFFPSLASISFSQKTVFNLLVTPFHFKREYENASNSERLLSRCAGFFTLLSLLFLFMNIVFS